MEPLFLTGFSDSANSCIITWPPCIFVLLSCSSDPARSVSIWARLATCEVSEQILGVVSIGLLITDLELYGFVAAGVYVFPLATRALARRNRRSGG